ncbi:NAD(P)-binding protein [Macroventuria anomochaeta]|uniref:NAD(P)-binding protein n=1 Tax=Macroventuria anomochaeta TaxID=301207 RepID=A0ACB6RMZ4_9PLEO|nr:NAD(P)-binding protein [Macroventuria anomochaeta]KAF2623178.1 NAD(P)-binding protein [Macroventuria anomochaeta]
MSTNTKPLLAVFGATGNQGHSVASTVLSDPELSQRYAVRAVSRNVSNPKMQALASAGAELAAADMDKAETLPSALAGVHTLFFLTATQYTGHTREIETRQARSVCEAALAAGVSYIIFSSMSHPFAISNGKLRNVEHFDDKAEIEQYVRGLDVKSAFFAPASFMQNFMTHFMRPVPSPAGDGTYALANCAYGGTRMPFIDVTETGKWVGAILAAPEKFEGKQLAAASEILTMDEVAEIVSRVTGKVVKHQNLPDEVFKGFMPEGMREQLYEMWAFQRDYGYYGPTMDQDVQWAKDSARGELTGLEAFLRKHNYALE